MKPISGIAVGLAAGLLLSSAAGASSLSHRVLRTSIASPVAGMVPTLTRAFATAPGMKDLGVSPATQPMRIVLGMQMPNKSMIDVILRRQITAGDSMEGKFLTPAETNSLFSPSGAAVNAAATYLVRSGFSNVHVTPDNLLITADGTTGIADRAFATSIHNFSLHGKTVIANVSPAMIPAALKGAVISVLGLNTVPMVPDIKFASRPAVKQTVATTKPVTTSTPEPCNGISTPGVGCVANEFDAQQFRTTYDVVPNPGNANTGTNTAKNTSIAIFTEGDMTSILSDLKLYEKANNLVAITPQIIHPGIASSDASGADEFDLDTQSSTGISLVVKNLYLYDMTSLTDADTTVGFDRFQTDDIAKAGSASFAGCEVFAATDGTLTTADEIFARSAVQGQTVFNSSGDNGSGCPVAASTGVPASGLPMQSYPDVSPYVVSVGGTTVILGTAPGAGPAETLGWIGSGGGISLEDSAPFWQQGVVNAACYAPSAVPTVDTMKCVPDIAMDADNQLSPAVVYVGGASEGVGGTSLASPLALGSWALIESRANNKFGFAAPLLYQMYKNHTSRNATTGMYTAPVVVPPASQLIGGLTDVTTGANGQYQALPGYDNVTGLGSFDVQKTLLHLPVDYTHGP